MGSRTSHDGRLFQIQIVKKRTAVPDNRDYIYEREAELKAFEGSRIPLDKVAV
ncbi:hypothetical protein MOV61_07005 [Neorhizobium sp. BETTINA12A]|nr:hypothetical protein [Neorhizobium sp. BETTINA12A]MCJ9750469.1 hypothetical protein [Neorhizobium sp. BETTINA12A]